MLNLSSIGDQYYTPVLLYHATYHKLPTVLDGNIHNVRPETLYKQLSWLKANYDFVFVDELFNGRPMENVCAVTFDDAYMSVFDEAAAVLESLNVPYTVYLNSSSFYDEIFWRDKVRFILNNNLVGKFVTQNNNFCAMHNINEDNFYGKSKSIEINSCDFVELLNDFLSKLSHTAALENFLVRKANLHASSKLAMFGNHSHNHYLLSSLNTDQEVQEISRCHDILSDSVPKDKISKIFSIPFGGINSISSAGTSWLLDNGYVAALMSRSRINLSHKMFNNKLHNFPILERFMPVDDLALFQQQFFGLKVRELLHSVKNSVF